MIRLADYMISTVADAGIDTAFMVTGGFAMHLNDALAGEARITKICHHHEQAAAYAAEGYGHIVGRPALLQVTAGPGVINAMSGVFGAYTDSIPMLVISGQSKRQLVRAHYGFEGMRQLGEQEVDAVAMVQHITKYARQIRDESRIVFELDKALHLATSGRPGPVWLDIPFDVQACSIDPNALSRFLRVFTPAPEVSPIARNLLHRIERTERPLLMVGPDLSPATAEAFRAFAHTLRIPVVGAGAQDCILNDHPLYAGRMGIVGTRAGNIALQNADFILCFGMRPHIGLVTYNWESMASRAHVVVVDEDPYELEKPCTLADEAILCEPLPLLESLRCAAQFWNVAKFAGWLAWCKERVTLLPAVPEHLKIVTSEGHINPYYFVETLSSLLADDDVLVASNASSSVIPLQAAQLKGKQRFFSNHGNGAMGFGLPAAIGASLALPGKRIICLEGDGSLMMNIQELQTVLHHQLPIVIVVFNNNGYLSIKQTQRNFFGRALGSDPESGLSLPDFVALAKAWGIHAVRIQGTNFRDDIQAALAGSLPVLLDVILEQAQGFEPKVSSRRLEDGRMVSSPPEDMFPFLAPEALKAHMLDDWSAP